MSVQPESTLPEATPQSSPSPTGSSPAGQRRPVLAAIAWFGVVCWAATIYWLSSQTGPEIEEMNIFQLSDKVAHCGAFAAGAVAMVCAMAWSGATRKRTLIVTIAFLVLYGAADEIHQLSTPNRSGADVYDWTADSIGSIAGTLGTLFVYGRKDRSNRTRRATPAGT